MGVMYWKDILWILEVIATYTYIAIENELNSFICGT